MRLFPLWLMLLILDFPNETSGACDKPQLLISPKSPFRYQGEALNLSCKATAPNGLTLDNASLLMTMLNTDGNQIECSSVISFSNSTCIVINSNTEVLIPSRKDNIDNDYICQLTVPECKTPVVTSTLVAIDHHPKSVDSVSCVIYTWDTITCVLDLSQSYRQQLNPETNSYGLRIDVDVRRRRSPGQLTDSKWLRCPNLTFVNKTVRDAVTCSWDFLRSGISADEVYEFQVNVTNLFRMDSVRSILHTKVLGPTKPSNVTVDAINNTLVHVSWNRDNRSDVTGYIIHWCKTGVNYKCVSDFSNLTVLPNEGSPYVLLPGPFKEYLIGVSTTVEAQERLISSGITWSTCTQFKYGIPNNSMHISVNYTDSGVLLAWAQYKKCNPEYGVANIAKVTIQNVDKGNKTAKCNSGWGSCSTRISSVSFANGKANTLINVPMSSDFYLVTDLPPGRYNWWVQSQFPGGLSRASRKGTFVINGEPSYWKYMLISLSIAVLVLVAIVLVVGCRKRSQYLSKMDNEIHQPDSDVGRDDYIEVSGDGDSRVQSSSEFVPLIPVVPRQLTSPDNG